MSWFTFGRKRLALFVGVALLSLLGTLSPALAAGTENDTLAQQIVAAINGDRTTAGLPALTVDPRLSAIAVARAQYMLAEGFFSHCVGNEADLGCTQTGYDFPGRAQAAGINLNAAGTTWEENLALNNDPAGSAASQTNQQWLNSPEHRANIMGGAVTYTGVAAVCCFSGIISGQTLTADQGYVIYVQVFAGGPGATPPATKLTVGTPAVAGCQFVLGFATIAGDIPQVVGGCADDEQHNPANGDALQHTTTGGLLVWRKADNWTAFTDGFHTWINGPHGIAERLNTQRFTWEANPSGLPVV